MKIFIASDHRGYDTKQTIFGIFNSLESCEMFDCGTNSNDRCDFPNYAKLVCDRIENQVKYTNELCFGILICGSGVGMSIMANRYKKIRCCLAYDRKQVIQARQHNNCNVIALSADNFDISTNLEFVKDFVLTEFENDEIYQKRIEMLDNI